MQILELIESQKSLIKGFGISEIGLFGSFARGEETERSDIDLLIEFEEGKKNFDNFINLAYFLEDIFDRKVELITKEALNPRMLEFIQKDLKYANIN